MRMLQNDRPSPKHVEAGRVEDHDNETEPTSDRLTGSEQDVLRRRNALAGLWAAELLGLIGQAAADYAKGLTHHDDAAVAQRLSRDLHGHVGIAEIRAKLTNLLREARRQIHDRTPRQ